MSSDTQKRIRVVVVEDECFFRELLTERLAMSPRLQVLASMGTSEEALVQVPLLQPDVLVTDLILGGTMNGLQLGLSLRTELPTLGICVLSSHAKPSVISRVPADHLWGIGYLLKQTVSNLDALERAIVGAAEGMLVMVPEVVRTPQSMQPSVSLTPRELDVLKVMAEGSSNAAIGQRLGLTEKTVSNYANTIFRKLGSDLHDPGAQPRVQAVLYYLRELAPDK